LFISSFPGSSVERLIKYSFSSVITNKFPRRSLFYITTTSPSPCLPIRLFIRAQPSSFTSCPLSRRWNILQTHKESRKSPYILLHTFKLTISTRVSSQLKRNIFLIKYNTWFLRLSLFGRETTEQAA
jgi:hypothetical protein